MLFSIHFIPLLAAVWQQPTSAPFAVADSGGSFVAMFMQTLLALGLVCGLAYAIFRWLLPRLNTARSFSSMVRIVDRTGLDGRKSLYVIEVAGRWLLIASSEAGVQLIGELDARTAEAAAGEVMRRRPTFGGDARAVQSAFAERLAQLMSKKGGGR